MKSLAIVQSYVPQYRVPFFARLIQVLEAQGIECSVLAGTASGAQSLRGDAADAPWITRVKLQEIPLGGRSIKLGGAARHWKGLDGVIVSHVGTSLDTYRALLDRHELRVGLWGHIRSYVNKPNWVDARLEIWQLGRADHVFAYTPGGAEYALAQGVEPARVTTVMNTVPTDELEQERDRIGEEEILGFRRRLGLGTHPVLAYAGGLDASKRIHFLAEALDHLWSLDRDIRVLIAGEGSQASLLAEAANRGQVLRLGYVNRPLLARAGAVSKAFLNPGRVGLVAVDALVMRRPILTTSWPFHAPEYEYLQPGETVFVTKDEPRDFAEQAIMLAREMRPTHVNFDYPHMDQMVSRFATGVQSMLSSGGSTRQVEG